MKKTLCPAMFGTTKHKRHMPDALCHNILSPPRIETIYRVCIYIYIYIYNDDDDDNNNNNSNSNKNNTNNNYDV